MTPLLFVGLLLITGLFTGLVFSRLGLPRIAAYVLAGILFSEDILGKPLGLDIGPWTETLTTAALGIVAFLVGGSITVGQLRRTGKLIVTSALGESLGAVFFVLLAMWLFAPAIPGFPAWQLAIAFAALAATTDPAATVGVLHQYHGKGPLSTTLLGVAALDDAFGILIFSILLVITTGQSITINLSNVVIEIGSSILIGIFSGWLLSVSRHFIRQLELVMPILLGSILLVVGLAQRLDLSPLLAAMALGFSARYFLKSGSARVFGPIEFLEEIVFVIFFTLAGVHFVRDVFADNLSIILIYFVARILGKIVGAASGAYLSGAPPTTTRWLGMGLISQAGVAVGLALTISHEPQYQQISSIVVNVILATTLLYELIGPLAARFALHRAGELGIKRKRTKNES